jgi:predicted O-methyltransferase YrrM
LPRGKKGFAMTANDSRQILREVADGYQNACILQAAAELDIFTVLLQGGNRLTAEELSAALQTNCRATGMLLDALTAADFLHKKDKHYSVAENFSQLLDSRTAETFVPMLRHLAGVQRAWTQLAKTVKTGVPPQSEPSILGADEDRRSFIWAMNSAAHTLAEPTVESLRQAGLLTFRKMIDIGGASGTYTLAFLKAMPELLVTIFDLPVGIAAAQKRFLGSEYAKRVQLVEGDIFQNDFPAGFDFAWISAVTHQFNQEENRMLYKKTFSALETGGKIAIRDFVMNEDRTAPKAGALFGINMLVETPHGQVYSFAEVREDLESVGFKEVRLAIPSDTMSAIITATKQ